MYNGSYGDDIDEREILLGILLLEPFSEMNPISREHILIWFFFFLILNERTVGSYCGMKNNFLLFYLTHQHFSSNDNYMD